MSDEGVNDGNGKYTASNEEIKILNSIKIEIGIKKQFFLSSFP